MAPKDVVVIDPRKGMVLPWILVSMHHGVLTVAALPVEPADRVSSPKLQEETMDASNVIVAEP